MADRHTFSDEPVVDSGARYRIGELSQDEIDDHRSKLPDESVTTGHAAYMIHGLTSQNLTHRHRRRRKRVPGSNTGKDDSPKPHPTDPTEHVMFLLGECDGDEEPAHQLFCELNELWHDPTGSGETEWRESARWIKFEEVVEENGERWSKPHVATLSLFSLFELRNSLANAAIMLNIEAFSMEQIADLIVNLLVAEGRLPADQREKLLEVLLRRHVHLHERLRPKLSGRSASHLPIIRSLADIGKRHSSKEVDKDMNSQPALAKLSTFTGVDHLDPTIAAEVAAHVQAHAATGSHPEAISASLQGKYDLHFLKKVPPGSETSNILVGETVFLQSQLTVFLRLKEAVLLGDLTEVPVPSRFLFIHLGTAGNALKYREIGRSMGVLMSDEVFHDVAYKAKSCGDLLAGLDEFLSAATVLPPGEWDPSIRIEPPATVPSQDSRKATTTNGPHASNNATASGPQPAGVVMEQLHAGGDRLAGLCLATATGSAKFLTHSESTLPGDAIDKITISVPEGVGGGPGDLPPFGGNKSEEVGEAGGGGGDEFGGDRHSDPALQRTGRIFGGLIRDIRRRAPHYLSDFTDALHIQCCASFIFLYFACLTPIITFGGLLSASTGGHLGTIESILSGAVVGILYSLFAGQPLTIMGSTGPVLIFENIVYNICQRMDWAYLSFRLWVGVWTTLILLIIVASDLSALVKFITRFTEESFAALIAMIFVIEALKKMFHVNHDFPIGLNWSPSTIASHDCRCKNPANFTDQEILTTIYRRDPLRSLPLRGINKTSAKEWDEGNFTMMSINWDHISDGRFSWNSIEYRDLCPILNGTWTGAHCEPFYVPDVFFFSLILFIFTYLIAISLKSMRTSAFFPSRVRVVISDFSVVIAIASTTLADFLLGLHTPKLHVPTKFEPTLGYGKRGWIIPAFDGNPWWTSLVAIGPSLVAVILIFMDQQITAVIVNRRENKLKKGAGYHLDLLLVAITILINSVVGIPWFVAATVLSINHVLSLKKESEKTAPGERPVYLGCREQRVTGTLIFLFIGLSVFMTRLLGRIPMAVLYGVFLFMGISSLNGVQMVQRVGLMFMPIKYQPDYPYLRHVPLRRVHMFTVIQITCLGMLYLIKSLESVSILFPIMVLAMCFIRKGLDFIFTQDELKWLDELLPGAKTGKPPNNVFHVTSLAEMPTKRLNITEEVSKTAIWRQLSGADLKEHVSDQTQGKHKGKRSRSRRSTRDSADANQLSTGLLLSAVHRKKPVVFCIDPKEETNNSCVIDLTTSPAGGSDTGHTAPVLAMPTITINPPSQQGSPETQHRSVNQAAMPPTS